MRSFLYLAILLVSGCLPCPAQMLINSYQYAPAAPTDPYWANVKLLLHNDSSSFPDVSSSPCTITVGGTSLETTIKKYGAGAASHGITSTSSTFLTVADDGRFALTNQTYCVEMWLYLPSPATSTRRLFDSSFLRLMGTSTAGTISATISANNFTSAVSIGTGSVGVATWAHVAVTHDPGGNFTLWINGSQAATNSSGITHSGTTKNLTIGGIAGGGNCIPCYVDDVRITVGQYRYPIGFTFTPPTEAFPDH